MRRAHDCAGLLGRLPIALVLAIAPALGCRAPYDNVRVVLDRRATTVEKLPDEEHFQSAPNSTAVVSERTEELLPDGVLTVEAARRIAVRTNPDVHAAWARLEAALARIDEARSRFFPTVALTHTSARTFHTPASRNRLNTLLQPSQPTPTDVDIQPQELAITTILNAIRRPLFGGDEPMGNANAFSEHSTALAATWMVFDGFVRDAQLLAARHLHHAAEQSLADVERLIVQAVDTAYYQVQLAQEQIRIAKADEAFSREQLEETEKLRAAGRASRADVDNFRVRGLAAQANVTAAVGLRETGRVVLAELMGLADVTLPPEWGLPSLAEEAEEDMAVPDAGPWVEQAITNRPDLRQLQAVVRSEEQKVRAARGLYSPTVALSGSWGFDRSFNLRYTRQDQSTAAALDIRWDLYTGGARRAAVRGAESARAEAAAAFNRLRLAVQAEVRRAIIDLADAQEQIRLQRESLKTAGENRRIVQAAYVAGKETLTRLNEAHRDFIEAEANLALARIRLRQAWSDLYAAAATHGKTINDTSTVVP